MIRLAASDYEKIIAHAEKELPDEAAVLSQARFPAMIKSLKRSIC
jgi:hypothetical protein